jgi:hypothetical protein
MLKPTLAQPSQERTLRSLSFIQQSAIHEASLLGFGLQSSSRPQICLLSQHNEKFRLLTLTVCCMTHGAILPP